MVRIARERISTLFALAEREATTGHGALADRYVDIARRVGTRYNVRLLPEYQELYCRGCSTFWVEGRTVRTRLRAGHRVRTCLHCGRERRTLLAEPRVAGSGSPDTGRSPASRDDTVLAEAPLDGEPQGLSEDDAEEE
jgi:ribonuclease P protein subunit RPR2